MNIELKQREIKFRAWDNVHQCFDENVAANLLMQLHDPYEEVDEKYGERFFLSQYTGLKDKNGKEIYENDICKTPSSNGTKEQMAYGQIVFHKGSFLFHRGSTNVRIAVDMLVFYYSNCEIIGNIFENPELLK